jgi:hypothetical protein
MIGYNKISSFYNRKSNVLLTRFYLLIDKNAYVIPLYIDDFKGYMLLPNN